jgi:hypothetical protein
MWGAIEARGFATSKKPHSGSGLSEVGERHVFAAVHWRRGSRSAVSEKKFSAYAIFLLVDAFNRFLRMNA